MSKQTLAKPYHYWVEVLDKDDDRLSCERVFKTPNALQDWCINRLAKGDGACRVQIWFGAADPDNPNVEADWVNTYCIEPFEEFGQTAKKIEREGRAVQITGSGERFEYHTVLPAVYALMGCWYKPTHRKGRKQKAYTPINWEEVAS